MVKAIAESLLRKGKVRLRISNNSSFTIETLNLISYPILLNVLTRSFIIINIY